MLMVNNKPVFADMSDVLETLRSDLAARGLDRFRVIRHSGKDIMTNCPFHSNGQERKPSFGINKETGICHCFACGYSGHISDVISRLLGHDDCGRYGDKWILNHFLSVSVEDRQEIDLTSMKRKQAKKSTSKFVTEKELDSYRYIHPYMYQRGLTDDLIEQFDIGYDVDTDCITFPVKDLNGNVLFVARRSVKTKYFNYPNEVTKPIYGAFEALSLRPIPKQLIVCESCFNALTCWKFGKPAVALLGTGDANQYKILKELPFRKYIIATDPDNAGELGYQKLKASLQGSKIITRWIVPEGKDLNDLDEEILNLPEVF